LVLDCVNQLWVFGSNEESALGFISETDRVDARYPNPQLLTELNQLAGEIQLIAAGAYHSLAVDSQFRVWGFGSNCFGQLGEGSKSKCVPQIIVGLENVTQVWCGKCSSFAKDMMGRTLVFGFNDGYLEGASEYIFTPTENEHLFGKLVFPAAYCTLVVDEDGNLFLLGELKDRRFQEVPVNFHHCTIRPLIEQQKPKFRMFKAALRQ
jgi:hypothetical protein